MPGMLKVPMIQCHSSGQHYDDRALLSEPVVFRLLHNSGRFTSGEFAQDPPSNDVEQVFHLTGSFHRRIRIQSRTILLSVSILDNRNAAPRQAGVWKDENDSVKSRHRFQLQRSSAYVDPKMDGIFSPLLALRAR